MKNLFFLCIPVLLISLPARSQDDTLIRHQTSCPSGEWELVFADEFDADSLNSSNWVTWFPYTNDGSDQCAFCRTHGQEGQVYLDRNAEVREGTLRLIARHEPAEWFGQRREYTSGMIHSRQSFGTGKYEIRCRLPKGMGFWPAIWAYGANSAEIDILEAGMQHPCRYHMSIHNRNVRKMLHRKRFVFRNLSSGFHTYSLIWDTSYIRFLIDDKVIWKLTPYIHSIGFRIKRCSVRPGRYFLEPVFPLPVETVHLILNLAIGNEQTPFTGPPAGNTAFPGTMEIDWIRYYKRK